AGIVCKPTRRAARHRRSPAISSYSSPTERTSTGCNTPTSRIDSASDPSASSSKCSRGCCGFGRMDAIGSSARPPEPFATSPFGMSPPSPLPNPPCRATAHLLGQLPIRECAPRGTVEHRHGLAEGRRLRDPDRAGDHRAVHLVAEVGSNFLLHLL